MKKTEEKTINKEESKKIRIKLTTFFLLLVIFAIAIIFIYPNTRNKIINTISGNIENAEVEVYDDGSALFTDDSAIVESATIVNKVTGTESFDENDEPGNDSSATNNIVRSFDYITYELEANMTVNNTEHGSEEGNTYSSFRGGVIYVEATLPEENAGLMKWSLDDMAWTEGTGTLSEDGLTFTGQYKMTENQITIPGKQAIPVVLKVEGAGNGTNIKPTFRLWMQGNETNKENENYEALEITDNNPVVVSAKPGFNIKLVKNAGNKKVTVNFDDDGDNVTGRMYGYAIILQLYNQYTEKGLKGLEYPKGDITFDIKTKLEAVETIDGKEVTTDITDLATPRLWNYKVNVNTLKDGSAYGNIPNRNMDFGYYILPNYFPSGSGSSVPIGMENGINIVDQRVYNSGNILMEENGDTIRTTINNYEFNGIFPSMQYSGNHYQYGENIGCFSVGYFQLLVPDNEETLNENREYYLTVEDTNMTVNTLSNQQTTNQVVTSDDISRVQHYVVKPATYGNYIYLRKQDGRTYLTSGNAVSKGEVIEGQFRISVGGGEIGTEIKSVNRLVKFDGNCFEPVLYDNGEKFKPIDTMTFKSWYVTKKDGTNWINSTDRNSTNIEDLNMYENLEDIPEGYICVGMYFESQDGVINSTIYMNIRMKIKETANIGETYEMWLCDDFWTETLNRETQSAINPDAEYPEPVYSNRGTRASVLVLGANSSIELKTEDESTGEEKVEYDLGKNENVVKLQITPKLEEIDPNYPLNVTGATVRIKQTLPPELTYVPGSANYGEPIEKISNSDGTTTYIWDIYGCDVGKEIEPLLIEAEINPDTVNGTTLSMTSVIEPDKELIGLSALNYRTDTTEIKIINLANHSLTKEAENRVIENNGEVTYKVTYQNKTDYSMPDFQLLDILPYNGDGRGSDHNGTYVLKDVKVTQTASGSTVSNDNLSLYTTTNEEARKITPKDETIGVSDIWENKEIGSLVEEPVTVLALKGEIEPNTRVEMEITLKTDNNNGGDVYSNSVTARTSKDTEVITSTNSKVNVVKRIIEGNVWYDTNENGIKDEEEKFASGIEVEVLKSDGTKAVGVDGKEVENILTSENGEYQFSNLPIGEYIIKIYTEDKYKLTTANVGSNLEINSKFEEAEGSKQSYVITNLNNTQSPEIIEKNVNAGLVVKDAKVIVHYLEEDSTPNDDSDNNKLLEDKQMTGYKIGDSYSVNAENIENYITLRNSGNTSGTLNSEVVEVTYYYTYNKQDITVRKVWDDNRKCCREKTNFC